MGLSHFGDIRLSRDNEGPEFRLVTWLAMLFAAGMGIGLVFWGVAEPLHHFAGIPNRASRIVAGDAEGAQQRSEEHTSELQSRGHLVCRLLLEKKNDAEPPSHEA